MISLLITEIIGMINNRSAAARFVQLVHPYLRQLESLIATETPLKPLKRIYLGIDFDPELQHGTDGISFDKFSKKKGEAEMTIDIPLNTFLTLGDEKVLPFVANRIVQALHLLKTYVEIASSDLDQLISDVEAYNRATIPNYESVGARLNPTAHPQGSISAAVDLKFVVQFDESLFSRGDLVEELEEQLEEKLGDDGEVDGHDVGQDRFNIFIDAKNRDTAFRKNRDVLKRKQLLEQARIAIRSDGEDEYQILWPSDSPGALRVWVGGQ